MELCVDVIKRQPDERWAMDFMSDALVNGRRIRALTIVDLWDRTSPALESEISLTGRRWRALERLRPQGRMPQFTGKALDA